MYHPPAMEMFPVTESTLSALHLGLLLQDRYRLSGETRCRLFRTGMNHLYQVADGENKFVFRVYTLHWRTKTDIAEEIRLLRHLQQSGVPVSYPIADREGEFIQEIQAPEGARFAVLFSYADGVKSAKFSPQTSYSIGVAMAKMHRATENFPFNRSPYNAQTLLSDSFARVQSFFTAPSEAMTYLAQTEHYLQKEYEKVDTGQIRQGVVHLDIWFDNMHFNAENGVTIFDFDFCGSGWLCLDIAYFLCQLYNTHPDENDFLPKAESFWNGYESITPVSSEEKRIIPIAALGVFLFYIGIQCDRFDTWSNIFLNEDHLKRFTGTMKKWMAYHKIKWEKGV